MFILTLTVVLLASFGINDSDIAVFYISLMLSHIAGGSLALSIAYMVIPASSKSKVDLSSSSLRIGMSLTVPLIVAFLTAPRWILSLLGPDYSVGGPILFVLALGIFPFIIMLNGISKMNNLNKQKNLIIIGIIQIISFLVAFWLLVPEYETLGAAYAILIAFIVSSIPSAKWLGGNVLKITLTSAVAIVSGWVFGFTLTLLLGLHPIFTILISVGVSLAIVFQQKSISLKEIRQMMGTLSK